MLSERRGVEQAHHMNPAGRRVVRCDDAGKDPVCGMRVKLDVRHLTPHIALAPICVTPNLRGRQPVGWDGAAAPLPLAFAVALRLSAGGAAVCLALTLTLTLALALALALARGRRHCRSPVRCRCRFRSRARWPCRCRCCCPDRRRAASASSCSCRAPCRCREWSSRRRPWSGRRRRRLRRSLPPNRHRRWHPSPCPGRASSRRCRACRRLRPGSCRLEPFDPPLGEPPEFPAPPPCRSSAGLPDDPGTETPTWCSALDTTSCAGPGSAPATARPAVAVNTVMVQTSAMAVRRRNRPPPARAGRPGSIAAAIAAAMRHSSNPSISAVSSIAAACSSWTTDSKPGGASAASTAPDRMRSAVSRSSSIGDMSRSLSCQSLIAPPVPPAAPAGSAHDAGSPGCCPGSSPGSTPRPRR